MLPSLDCRVLVVGAGPAGSCAAAGIAAAGVKTLLIDSKKRIGEQPHCGEFVPRQLFVEFDLDKSCIHQAVDTMETLVVDLDDPTGGASEHTSSVSPGFLIDRVLFDRGLAREAAASGATVLAGARLTGREHDSWMVSFKGHDYAVNPEIVIAADGAMSTVTSLLGLERPEVLRGVQVEVPLEKPLDRTFVLLSRELVGGYGWLFPKGLTANVGLGVAPKPNISPSFLLNRLIEWLRQKKLIREGTLASSGGLIPVSGIRQPLVLENVILTGDAAGLTHPITGAGIAQAVFSGRQAGLAAIQCLKTGSRNSLEQYEQEVRTRYEGPLNHARAKRNLMMSMWDCTDFNRTCNRSWIGFRGYKKRVREESAEKEPAR
jgi:geranylgeranyl reductase family protein